MCSITDKSSVPSKTSPPVLPSCGLATASADALAGHREVLADLFQRVVRTLADAEAHLEHLLLARGEREAERAGLFPSGYATRLMRIGSSRDTHPKTAKIGARAGPIWHYVALRGTRSTPTCSGGGWLAIRKTTRMSAADVALITSIELQHRERKPYQYFTNDENGRPKTLPLPACSHEVVIERLRNEVDLCGDVHFTAEPPERTDDGEAAAPFLRVKERIREPEGRKMSRAEMYEFLLTQHGAKCQGCDRAFDDPRLSRTRPQHSALGRRTESHLEPGVTMRAVQPAQEQHVHAVRVIT